MYLGQYASTLRATYATRVSITLTLLLAVPSVLLSQEVSPWSVGYTTERADVSIGGADRIWTTDHVQLSWTTPQTGGWTVAIDRFARAGVTDVAVSGNAYKRANDWTYGGGGAWTADPSFIYRGFVGGDVSRRVVSTIVAGVGYRFLAFRGADIHQVTPSVVYYHPHGEVGFRVFSTSNTTASRTTRAVALSALYDITARVRVAGGVSVGTRIFDVAALPTAAATSHVGYVTGRVGLTAHDFVEVGASLATEDPDFTYRSFTAGYRRVF